MVIQQNPNMSTLQLLKLKTNSGMRELALHEPFNYLHVRLKLREERKSSLTHGYHFQSGYLIFWGPAMSSPKKQKRIGSFDSGPRSASEKTWNKSGEAYVCRSEVHAACVCQQRVSKSIVPLIHTKCCKSKASSLGARSQGVRTYSKN